MKVVINTVYNGLGLELGTEVYEQLIELGMTVTEAIDDWCYVDETADICKHIGKFFSDYTFVGNGDKLRSDERLIGVIETQKKYGHYPNLKIVEIPDGVEYRIGESDYREWVIEKHTRKWG